MKTITVNRTLADMVADLETWFAYNGETGEWILSPYVTDLKDIFGDCDIPDDGNTFEIHTLADDGRLLAYVDTEPYHLTR